ELERAALKRRAEVRFDLAPLLGALVEALFEEGVGAPPRLLGAVKGEIGIPQQRAAVAAVVGRDRDSDAGRGDQLVAVDAEGLGDRGQDLAGEAVDRVAV